MVLFRAIKVFRYIFQLYPEQTVIFNPTIKELSRAIQTLVGEEMMQNAYIIVLDSLVSDGFFDENTDKENRLVKKDIIVEWLHPLHCQTV